MATDTFFSAGEQEVRIAAERKDRVAAITELKNEREKQAAIYIENTVRRSISFEHYGDMSIPRKRMMESDELNEKGQKDHRRCKCHLASAA